MQISVVIPAFNEEGNIGRLVRETFDAVSEAQLGEVVVVDDCSTDATVSELSELK
ncbi:MAG: glycosyltransferase, partial [Nitratireductor sp.]|nr:glycosyltransferase [Nitratireductor sp.]